MLPTLQGLEVGRADDALEREADQIADRVVRDTSSTEPARVRERVSGAQPHGRPLLSAKRPTADAARSATGRPLGAGQRLSPATRAYFEPRLDWSFEDVRVHVGGAAAALAQGLGARAFTVANEVVFGAGEFAPHTSRGRRLLAHELAHVIQQSGVPASRRGDARVRLSRGVAVQRYPGGGQSGAHIELCFVPIGQFYLGQVGGRHAILNIHRRGRVTRVEVDPHHHTGAEDPGALAGPGHSAGIHSHVVISSTARSAGLCVTIPVTDAQATAAVDAATRYEQLDVDYEPPGLGPNSNGVAEWVLHEAGVQTANIGVPMGALGWGWYQDHPAQRAAPPRVARTFGATQSSCPQSGRRAGSFQALVDLLRRVEAQLSSCGVTDVGEQLNIMRGAFYGTPWSPDYATSQGSHLRNQMFNVYSGSLQPRNPLECVDCGLFLSLGLSQDITDAGRQVDVGHMLIGMDARRSVVARTVSQPIGQVTGLEATTWAGDLGGGAARLAMARRTSPSTLATRYFQGSDYGGSINLEGDVAGYAVGAASPSPGVAPPLSIAPGQGVADAVEAYLLGTAGSTAVAPGWATRCTSFLTAVGGTFGPTGALANRGDVLAYLTEQIHDFGCWYMVTFQSGHPLSHPELREASRHMAGAAAEVAEVFLAALEHCHTNPSQPLAAGSAPTPTPIGAPSCALALSRSWSEEQLEDARQRGGELLDDAERELDRARREGGRLLDEADEWIERRQEDARRWLRNMRR